MMTFFRPALLWLSKLIMSRVFILYANICLPIQKTKLDNLFDSKWIKITKMLIRVYLALGSHFQSPSNKGFFSSKKVY